MRSLSLALVLALTPSCLRPAIDDDPPAGSSFVDAIDYRDDLAAHPGCSTAGRADAAAIPGYPCAAKDYGADREDTAKPIVLLVHGNSDTPAGWETSVNDTCNPAGATQGVPMLAERLADDGYRVLAVDLRADLVDNPAGNNETENAAKNMDHGWAVPLVQRFIAAVLEANPQRQISVVGFSLGATVVRDALRRLDVNDGVAIWPRLDDVVLLAGANHGVSTFALCGTNATMRGQVTCQMGDRAAYAPTPFLAALNGTDGEWETPCGEAGDAFGRAEVCGDHVVEYTTVVMQDIPGGTQQDPFVSEASAALAGADNRTVGLNDFDTSDYFFCGLFKDHYGAARSLAAIDTVRAALAD